MVRVEVTERQVRAFCVGGEKGDRDQRAGCEYCLVVVEEASLLGWVPSAVGKKSLPGGAGDIT